uniref:Uncharacterized protein n=1 Tax=Romanomermis culicivorax TaxID=13658 RepID=A0A915JWW4_ROMCU
IKTEADSDSSHSRSLSKRDKENEDIDEVVIRMLCLYEKVLMRIFIVVVKVLLVVRTDVYKIKVISRRGSSQPSEVKDGWRALAVDNWKLEEGVVDNCLYDCQF